jgi:glyoxylase-like metal-dependent hydrolase (beta-lactamase superfamily II)
VRDGDRIVLIDTGAAGEMGTDGRLLASLTTAGVKPEDVTDILISHGHGDHVGGVFAKDGTLAFPNAAIRISIPEWTAMHDNAEFEEQIKTMTPKVRPFAPGSKVTPSITAVSLDGHTPGHTGYEIQSGTERLLYIGDALHSSIISVQRPDWTLAWDDDATDAKVTRQRLLDRGAADSLRIYGVHFPFPGLGRFQRSDDGFVWVPEAVAH